MKENTTEVPSVEIQKIVDLQKIKKIVYRNSDIIVSAETAFPRRRASQNTQLITKN